MKKIVLALALAAALVVPVSAGEGIVLEIDPQAIVEILPLATEALAIQQRAMEREEGKTGTHADRRPMRD